ncbi:hypothetical protein FIV00_19775 [Labrenzia sp. THAF82]|uniref:hypothetical protein n=1 Tax=Labrenzia sp. THAF82 TaxID=2587861 RepID=UPI0012691B64|nr:hypothetical protein [Labrenzia sp. THAF82]QFT32739.1 hypothetical protein FIV00_19775 [Labrenzia sp. THAF82]
MTGPFSRYLKLPKDPLFRLLVINGAAGLGIAALVLGGIFLANIGNLRELVLAADDPFLPVIMLAFGLIITLVSVVMGSAIMLLGDKSREGGGGGKPKALRFSAPLNPIPVTVAGRGIRKDRD